MMADLDIELGEYTFVGNHNTDECDKGRVFRNTPQKIDGRFWPPASFYDIDGELLPTAVTEWHWCKRCGASTKNKTLNMKEVKLKT